MKNILCIEKKLYVKKNPYMALSSSFIEYFAIIGYKDKTVPKILDSYKKKRNDYSDFIEVTTKQKQSCKNMNCKYFLNPNQNQMKRKVILYSTPKLVYIDPSTNKVKGEIYLDKSLKVNRISMTIFELISPKRSFRFKACDGDILVWEKSIIDAIKQYSK